MQQTHCPQHKRTFITPIVLDVSFLQDDLYFIKVHEQGMKDKSIWEITRMIADLFDIVYFSGCKFDFGGGGGSLVHDEALFHAMEDYITIFKGFLTYGGLRFVHEPKMLRFFTGRLKSVSDCPKDW